MEGTIRALTELASIDRRLAEEGALPDEAMRQMDERRAALRRQVSGLLLTAYDALVRAGRHPAIVAARADYCGGCNLRLPAQLANQVRTATTLLTCPHCRRLLHR